MFNIPFRIIILWWKANACSCLKVRSSRRASWKAERPSAVSGITEVSFGDSLTSGEGDADCAGFSLAADEEDELSVVRLAQPVNESTKSKASRAGKILFISDRSFLQK